ncbi:hypothetical protein BV898_06739 [Hypsibius exemplaris]|uniref:EB domain-containing protein n=1 Tax=Hypsibius exemplaris TaxID=2072580 RepID=A0A1W0WVU0_HYPEX|nr:hypothetical protein BV898_06739 [Hypsibius exemplaris]
MKTLSGLSFVTLTWLVLSHSATGSRREKRQMGLNLHEWCYKGPTALMEADCSLPGMQCVGAGGVITPVDIDGQGVCKCKDKFEETGPTPHDRCIPKATTPFAEAECDTNDDCIKLPGTTCRTQTSGASAGKRLCNCKDDFEQDPALIALATPAGPAFGCKSVTCTDKTVGTTPDTFCGTPSNPPRPGAITGSKCVAGKCACADTQTRQIVAGIPTCLDPTAIPCTLVANNPSGTCPFISGGTAICSAVGNSSLKCSCQINATKGGTITSAGGSALTCAPNSIGSLCFKSSDCPDPSVTCMKSGVWTPEKKGICACSPYKNPRRDNIRCDATIGLCCKSSADCGMAPSLMNPNDKPFACLRPLGNELFGTCGCPVGTQWDAVSCKVIITPGQCPAVLIPPVPQ